MAFHLNVEMKTLITFISLLFIRGITYLNVTIKIHLCGLPFEFTDLKIRKTVKTIWCFILMIFVLKCLGVSNNFPFPFNFGACNYQNEIGFVKSFCCLLLCKYYMTEVKIGIVFIHVFRGFVSYYCIKKQLLVFIVY